MSINKIIVNTTTGAQAATSINSTIDLAEAAATLGANEFTGDQLITGTSKQIFPVPQDPNEFTNIAKVTGAVQSGINIEEINFAFAPTNPNSAISNSWLLEAYTDSTFTEGSEISLGFNRGKIQLANSIGSLALMTVLNNPNNNLTTLAAFADNMFIGANAAQTRNGISIGHTALPNLNLRGTNINTFASQLTHNGELEVFGQVGLFGDVVINNGNFDVNGNLNVNGAANFTGGNLVVQDANISIQGTGNLSVTGFTSFSNNVNINTGNFDVQNGNFSVNGQVATTGDFIHSGDLTIFDGSINMQPGTQVNTPVIDAGIARVSDFLVVGDSIGSGDGLTVNNTDFVITPVASLPAGVEGQIAFSGGFMWAYFQGDWQQINTTIPPPPVEQFFSEYDASSAAAACTSETISEVWTDTWWFVGGYLWTDEGKTTLAADGFYKFGDNAYELVNGEMVSETACA